MGFESALFDNSKQKSATKITDDNNKEDESGGEKKWKVYLLVQGAGTANVPHKISKVNH